MLTVKIMQGIPGSGKSTYARKTWPGALILSSDDYFMKDGKYVFDPSKLGEYHGRILKNFSQELMYCTRYICEGDKDKIIVIDNTNTKATEIAPYYQLALAYRCDVEIVKVLCSIKTGFARNQHGV